MHECEPLAPGRVLLMDQDMLHRVSTPSQTAVGRYMFESLMDETRVESV